MLSILVCHSYYLRLDQKQWERAKPYPPLATLQVAQMLRAAGHRVEFFDAMLAEGVGDYVHVLEGAAATRVAVRRYVQFSQQDVPRRDAAGCLRHGRRRP